MGRYREVGLFGSKVRLLIKEVAALVPLAELVLLAKDMVDIFQKRSSSKEGYKLEGRICARFFTIYYTHTNLSSFTGVFYLSNLGN